MRPSKRRAGYDVAAPARAIGHVLYFTVFTEAHMALLEQQWFVC